MKRSSLSVLAASGTLLTTTVAMANPVTLYATSYESPEYSVGALNGQAGWFNSFDIDPTVDSSLARTGSQSLRVQQSANQPPFGLTFQAGPYTTALPQISVEHSIYLAGATGWNPPSTFLSPMALIGDNGFITQLPVRDGTRVQFGTTNFAISTDTWIDLKLVLDFSTQTVSAFVDGNSLGTLPFENAATQLSSIELFHIFDNTSFNSPGPSNSFFLDDLKVTAIPAPSSLALLACAPLLARRRRERSR